MILKKIVGLMSLSVVLVGCSNQNQESISIIDPKPASTATAANLPNSGLVTIKTSTSTGKYVSNDATNILKANNTYVGPLQQFYMSKNSDNTYSLKSLSNSQYVTVQSDQSLAVLNQTIDNTNKFLFNSASSLDPEKVWINYQNAYQGWLNIGESYITLGLNQTTYKIAVDKIYGSSGVYNSSDYSYSWSSIYLQDVYGDQTSGGVDYYFYANGTIEENTSITITFDTTAVSQPFVNGCGIRAVANITGYHQHDITVQFNKPVSFDHFEWTVAQ